MDLLMKLLPTISKGCVTSRFGGLVWRVGDKYLVAAESIKVTTDRGEFLNLEDACRKILELRK